MPGLVLKLRPFEELMINGVIVENGDRNARLRVKTAGANILRLRNALKSEEAKTPVEQACYIAQLAVGGSLDYDSARDQMRSALNGAADTNGATLRNKVNDFLLKDDFYGAMRYLSALVGDNTHCCEGSTP